VIAEGAERDRGYRQQAAVALVRFLLTQDSNNAAILTGWTDRWAPQVLRAVDAIAPLFEATDVQIQTFAEARQNVVRDWRQLLSDIGLQTQGVAA